MVRGSTPKHTFNLPFEVPEGACVRIVYAQNDVVIVEKTATDCNISGSEVVTRLTSEETLLFDCTPHFHNGRKEPYPVEIQIGIKTVTGDKIWSNIIETTVDKCLRKDGVI